MVDIIVDSKSGLSGAGRNINQDLLFCENKVQDSIRKETKKNLNLYIIYGANSLIASFFDFLIHLFFQIVFL